MKLVLSEISDRLIHGSQSVGYYAGRDHIRSAATESDARRTFESRTPAMKILRDKIGSLSEAEKFDLLDVLWESLEADGPVLTAGQRDELDCRIARYRENPADVIPWKLVKANLLKRQ